MASNVVPVTFADATAAIAVKGSYFGFSLRETTGAAGAVVKIWDNASAASGKLLDSIALVAGESAREWYGYQGIEVYNGVYMQLVSGAVEGSVRVG